MTGYKNVGRSKVYLFTGGLVPLLTNRYGLQLNCASARKIECLEKQYAQNFSELVADHKEFDANGEEYAWDVRFTSAKEIDKKLRSLVGAHKDGIPLISFDDVYCRDLADGFYSVTRLMDANDVDADTISGPRFGNPSLDEQVSNLAKEFGPKVNIMDIGVFEGETLLREIKQRFVRNGLKVSNVFVMYAGPLGITNLSREGIDLKYVETLDWIDWLEMRDCIGFDGRKVCYNPSKKGVQNAFVKYTERPNKWASIPEGYQERFATLYKTYFDKAGRVLVEDGYSVTLTQVSATSPVHELKIVRVAR